MAMPVLAAAAGIQGAINAYGTLLAGEIQAAGYRAAARADEFNAAVSRQRGEMSRLIYGQREEQVRRGTRQQLGQQNAQIAESRLGGNEDLERQNAILAELDALNVRYEGELEFYGHEAEARLSEFSAGANRSLAKASRRAARIGAAGDLLGGGAQAYGFMG